MTADSDSPGFSLMLDPSLKRARDLRLLAGVLCLVGAAGMLAIGMLSTSMLAAGAVAAVVGVAVLVKRRGWALQTRRAEECARDAVPAIATIIAETTGRGGVRRVTLRAEGADAASDFTWLLPAAWGDIVRLDRAGRRVAVLAPVAARERCVPLLRSGRPFVVPDYVAAALIALLLEDIPAGERHPDVADLEAVPSGTIPPPPPLPVALVTTPEASARWWWYMTAAWVFSAGGAWLATTRGGIEAVLGGLFLVAVGVATLVTCRRETVSVVVSADALELRGPFARWLGSQRIGWDDIGSVSLRWSSRGARGDAEEISLKELVASGVLHAVAGVHVRLLDAQEFDVGDLAGRLVRGDIIPEVDTLVVTLLSSSGKRLSVCETRTAFQAVRALLARCEDLGVPVESSQALPGG